MPIPPKLLFLFIAIPVIEVILFVKIGGAIGLGGTLLIIVITAIIGAWLTRVQGVKAIEKFQRTVGAGQPPHGEIFDGVLILIAGVLLITPGFFTDAFGFLLLAPPIRAVLRSRIASTIEARYVSGGFPGAPEASPPPKSPSRKSSKRRPQGKVIDAEIVDE